MLPHAQAVFPAAQLVRGLRRLVSQESYGLWQTWRHALLQLAGTPTLQEQVKAETIRALRQPPPEQGVLLPVARAELPTVLALVALYAQGGEATDSVRLQLQRGLDQLLQAAELTPEETSAYHQMVSVFNERLQQQKTFKLTQHARSQPVVLELSARVVLYLATLAGQMPHALFATLSFAMPLLLALALSRRAKHIQKRYGDYFAERGFPVPQLALRVLPWQYALVAVSTLLLIGLPAVLLTDDYEVVVVLGLAYSLLFYFLQTRLCLPSFSEEYAETWLKHYQSDHESKYSPDQNDGLLAELSISLKGQQQRVEAFVLEAALFGALAFSAFVQIMATEFVILEEIPLFLDRLGTVVTQVALLEPVNWHLLAGKNNLFSIICLETLACSLVFLTVVASRLRFNDHSQQVDAQLALALAYNDKEEFLQVSNEAPEPSPIIQPRIQELSRRVRTHLINAQASLEKSDTVMAFMRYFRDLGVASFFLVIVTSSLLFSLGLALLFVAVFVFGLTYHRTNAFIENLRTLWQRVEEFYLRRSVLFEWIPWLLIALAISLALLRWPGDGLLALLGVLILVAGIVLRPALVAEMDYQALSARRMFVFKAIRRLQRLALFMLLIGMAMKVNGIPLANELLILGFQAMAFYFFPLSLWLGQGFKWRNLLVGWLVAVGLSGILSTLLHFRGVNEIKIMGGLSSALALVLLALPRFRTRIPAWFRGQVIVGAVMAVFIGFTPLLTVFLNASLGYQVVGQMIDFEKSRRAFGQLRDTRPLMPVHYLKHAQEQIVLMKKMKATNPDVGYILRGYDSSVLGPMYVAAVNDTSRRWLPYTHYLTGQVDSLLHTPQLEVPIPAVAELQGILYGLGGDSSRARAAFVRADTLGFKDRTFPLAYYTEEYNHNLPSVLQPDSLSARYRSWVGLPRGGKP